MQKELPILFSTPMVEAILENRKTMTRRMKGLKEINKNPEDWELIGVDCSENSAIGGGSFKSKVVDNRISVKAPYGRIGDILYVRETWAKYFRVDENGYTHFDEPMLFYKADGIPDIEIRDADGRLEDDQTFKWKPGIHLPKADSRIWLEVTGVRVERIQDITESDAVAEGVIRLESDVFKSLWMDYAGDEPHSSAKHSFQSLWNKINGEETWQKNARVWSYSFKVLSKTGKPIEEPNDERSVANQAK